MEFKVITISLANHIVKQLQDRCNKTGQKPTDVIRQAVFEFLNMMPDTVECKHVDSDIDANE